jgi:hypothetical protein
MRIAGRGYKTGRFTYVGPPLPPDTDLPQSPFGFGAQFPDVAKALKLYRQVEIICVGRLFV